MYLGMASLVSTDDKRRPAVMKGGVGKRVSEVSDGAAKQGLREPPSGKTVHT